MLYQVQPPLKYSLLFLQAKCCWDYSSSLSRPGFAWWTPRIAGIGMQFSLISRQPQHQLWCGRLLKAAKTGSEYHPFHLLGDADFADFFYHIQSLFSIIFSFFPFNYLAKIRNSQTSGPFLFSTNRLKPEPEPSLTHILPIFPNAVLEIGFTLLAY